MATENQDTLNKMIKFAEQSHTPHVPGDILDEQVCMKDHTKAKNLKTAERRR